MKSQDSSVGLTHDVDDLPSSGEGSNGRQPLDRPIPKHQRYNPRMPSLSKDSDLEVVALPQRLFLPDLAAGLVSPNGQLNSKAPRTPMVPPQKEMDEVNMDQYLSLALIPDDDKRTRERLADHGITHWSFFQSSDEDDLIALGFPAGVARLLWEGVPRLQEYCDGIEANRAFLQAACL
ncbi:hypothetical protein PGT21_000601 [Puccinia graminis f. sp. tritici]|uniref:Uncharacterized protein n=1 Tax=Puccinia graminis f. sp. tritici TaxID=56615 RepID=A0A5B0N6Z3_PUCGR|nr:hypothetical protein PGT21_000601 [Puccinia graminis f. sp. tritici]